MFISVSKLSLPNVQKAANRFPNRMFHQLTIMQYSSRTRDKRMKWGLGFKTWADFTYKIYFRCFGKKNTLANEWLTLIGTIIFHFFTSNVRRRNPDGGVGKTKITGEAGVVYELENKIPFSLLLLLLFLESWSVYIYSIILFLLIIIQYYCCMIIRGVIIYIY